MLGLLIISIIIALLAAFIITLGRKWGLVEWVQAHGSTFFAKMFSCGFCLSFWTTLAICLLIFVVWRDFGVLLAPFLSTPITRNLL